MIVRNNSGTIRACLESLKPWVDELVVVDTGSDDDTPDIAREIGARVFYFEWCDDFSAARNESIRHARGEWVFWMDSDDTIDESNGRGLRELACGRHEEGVLGYVVQVHCPGPRRDDANDVTIVDHVKLIRNLPEVRFDGRIHEQILPAIRRLGGEVGWTELFVVHSGYDHSPAGQERKRDRDLKLLGLELAERPEHPFTHFNLGMTYSDLGRHEEAIAHLEKSLPEDPAMNHNLGAVLLRQGNTGEAVHYLQRSVDSRPGSFETVLCLAHALRAEGKNAEAHSMCKRALLLDPTNKEASELLTKIRTTPK